MAGMSTTRIVGRVAVIAALAAIIGIHTLSPLLRQALPPDATRAFAIALQVPAPVECPQLPPTPVLARLTSDLLAPPASSVAALIWAPATASPSALPASPPAVSAAPPAGRPAAASTPSPAAATIPAPGYENPAANVEASPAWQEPPIVAATERVEPVKPEKPRVVTRTTRPREREARPAPQYSQSRATFSYETHLAAH